MRARALMVLGTASHVGKTWLVAGLCRLLARRGLRVAPFKAQNMALNAYVTPDGCEVARSVALQAEAAGVEPEVEMNPVLLKPTGERRAQLVLLGRPVAQVDAWSYRERFLSLVWRAVRDAYDRLASRYDLIILEGAGSPAEVNLRDRDLANLRMAAYADAPCVLVADIDRGGAFAALVGTLALLPAGERERVAGFVLNKFRGDPGLLAPGLAWLERRTGRPVFGVLPYLALDLDEEDSLSLQESTAAPGPAEPAGEPPLDLVVVRLPRISNFTDFLPLRHWPGVRVRYASRPADLGRPDAVLLPGTKNTIEDLCWLRAAGFAEAIAAAVAGGAALVGICGGYQMLGLRVTDPEGVESSLREAEGLGYLPVATEFRREKWLARRRVAVAPGGPGFWAGCAGAEVEGYEVHMGVTSVVDPSAVWTPFAGAPELGVVLRDRPHVFGTYLHGLFDRPAFPAAWLADLAARRGRSWRPPAAAPEARSLRQRALDRLADAVERHLDVDGLLRLVGP